MYFSCLKTVTINGTATQRTDITIGYVDFKTNINYVLSGTTNGETGKWFLSIRGYGNDIGNGVSYTPTENITKEICDYWHEHREVNKEYITTTDLIDIFKFDRSTIIKYLKKGNKIGWCSYDPKEEQRLGAMRSNALKRNKVLVYDLNMNYITEGESASWLSRNSVKKLGVKISQSKISDVATGKRSSYKGFIFKYAKDVDK